MRGDEGAADPLLRVVSFSQPPQGTDYFLVLAPGAGSPALDAGRPLFPIDLLDLDEDGMTFEPLPFDIRLRDRVFDDPVSPNASSIPVDIGAVELDRCSAADFDFPFGTLNFSNVLAYLAAFAAGEPGADLAPPFGVFNFSDVLAYITSFGDGCP